MSSRAFCNSIGLLPRPIGYGAIELSKSTKGGCHRPPRLTVYPAFCVKIAGGPFNVVSVSHANTASTKRSLLAVVFSYVGTATKSAVQVGLPPKTSERSYTPHVMPCSKHGGHRLHRDAGNLASVFSHSTRCIHCSRVHQYTNQMEAA